MNPSVKTLTIRYLVSTLVAAIKKLYRHITIRVHQNVSYQMITWHFLLDKQGPDVSMANKLFKNVIRVLCNANTTEGFDPQRDVSMAEIDVRPGQLGPTTFSLPPNNRTILSFFAGGPHGYIRYHGTTILLLKVQVSLTKFFCC